MRVLLAGRHELATSVLQSAARHIELIYVRPKHDAGGRGMSATDVARDLGLAIVDDDGEPALADAVAATKPDVLLSCGYPRIIKAEVISLVRKAVNVHFGALPKYRGSFSIPWAILNGEREIGVTLHLIKPGIDDGPIIAQLMLKDDGTGSCRTLYERAVMTGTEMAVHWLNEAAEGNEPESVPQDELIATYYPPRYPGGFRIDWKQSMLQVSRYIRAASFPPFAPAFGEIDDMRVGFEWPVTMVPDVAARSGEVVSRRSGQFAIGVINGAIGAETVVLDGATYPFADVAHRWLGRRFA